MIWKLLSGLVELFNRVGDYFARKEIKDAARAQTELEIRNKVEENVEKAENAVAVVDPVRTKRLRRRFDRSAEDSE